MEDELYEFFKMHLDMIRSIQLENLCTNDRAILSLEVSMDSNQMLQNDTTVYRAYPGTADHMTKTHKGEADKQTGKPKSVVKKN